MKVLAENWSADTQIRRRFLEEGRFLRRVDSPHVVAGYDAGELDDGRPYLVMSYADQGTLADRLTRLTPTQALEVLRQVGTGLQALHDQQIVHRDLKPANVLFCSSGPADEGPQRYGRWSATSGWAVPWTSPGRRRPGRCPGPARRRRRRRRLHRPRRAHPLGHHRGAHPDLVPRDAHLLGRRHS